MSSGRTLDDSYRAAEEWIVDGNLLAAESVLRSELDSAPRAAQSVYLLGVCLFLQHRRDEARRTIDYAFRLKLWLREPDERLGLESALACDSGVGESDWEWLKYQRLLRRWTSVGFTFERAVQTARMPARPLLLQIGANDGVSGDPIASVLPHRDWYAVLVEPLPAPFAALEERYRGDSNIKLINAALADDNGVLELHMIEGGKTTLASALPDRNALRHFDGELARIEVPAVTFESLFASESIERVDVLQIDTEGMDAIILRQFDIERYLPAVIHLEFYCLPLTERIEAMRRLGENGYAWRFTGRDLLCIRLEAASPDLCLGEHEHLAAV